MRILLALLLVISTACGGEIVEAVEQQEIPVEETSRLPEGEFVLGLALAPVSGLKAPFKVTVESMTADDGSEWITQFNIQATKAGTWDLSPVLATATDIQLDENRNFSVKLAFVLPGQFSPTSSSVQVDSLLTGRITNKKFFCGDVTGSLVTFRMDLKGSTFAALPWEDRSSQIAATCDASNQPPLERLTPEQCPTLKAGSNFGFKSGGLNRSMEIQLPLNYSADSGPRPLVFAWHGFGGTARRLLAGSLSRTALTKNVILVVPQATVQGGKSRFDAFNQAPQNPDIAFFDDLITCANKDFNVDLDRIYVTGMSNGAMMSGALLASRASKLAAAAPFSGSISLQFVKANAKIPALVSWGGVTDFAYQQNFDKLAREMIQKLHDQGHFVVGCNHNSGHNMPVGAWQWALDFLLAHHRTTTASPFASDLGQTLPSYCEIESQN